MERKGTAETFIKTLMTDYYALKESTQQDTNYRVIELLLDFEDAFNKAKFTKRQREVLYERYERGLTIKGVSERLGIDEKTVREHEKNAINKIAKGITKEV